MVDRGHSRVRRTVLGMVLVGCFGPASRSQGRIGVELFDPDPTTGSCFGCTVALEGDFAFVGEPGLDSSFTGAVHVYQRNTDGINGWGHLQTLHPESDDEYGFGMAISAIEGTLAVVRPVNSRAFLNGTICRSSALYFFEQDEDGQWRSVQRSGGEFVNPYRCSTGEAVALESSGDRFAFADRAGSVYVIQTIYEPELFVQVFERQGDLWEVVDSIIPDDHSHARTNAMAFSGDTVVNDYYEGILTFARAGSHDYATIDLNDTAGACYRDPAWTPRDPPFDDLLSMDHGLLAIGAPYNDDEGFEAGSVYIYNTDGLDHEGTDDAEFLRTELHPPDPQHLGLFGASLELRDHQLLVTGQRYGANAAVYLFSQVGDGSGWILEEVLEPPAWGSYEQFGRSLHLSSSGEVVIGSPSFDAASAGTAFVFARSATGLGTALLEPSLLTVRTEEDGAWIELLHAPSLTGSPYLVSDMTGRLVHSGLLRSDGHERIAVGSFAKGVYAIRVLNVQLAGAKFIR